MLDDLQKIHERDAQDALGNAGRQWDCLRADFSAAFKPSGDIANVVLAGMGGSALPGVLLGSWPGLSVPFEGVRDYTLPAYVDSRTLVILSSYSGNTEETLSALAQAEERGAQIVAVAAGGKLADAARAKGYALFEIPATGIQPRMATFYFWNAFIKILAPLGLTVQDPAELGVVAEWVRDQIKTWEPTVPTTQNQAKQIAQELMGKTVIVYSGPKLFPAANRWKICINENAKNLAWSGQYPELNHNEFLGWSGHPVEKPFAVVEIRSNLEHPRTQKRFEVSERLLSGMRPAPLVVTPAGDTLLQQLAWAVVLGDFVSIYLGLLNGVNPTPIELVEKFKTALDA